MITQELKQLVVNEALALRKHATKEEIGRLDFSKIDPVNSRLCPYGQMTGNCFSDRATELLKNCAIPYSSEGFYFSKPVSTKKFIRKLWKKNFSFSAIEFYINQDGAKTEDLIKLIKSNRN